MDIHSDRASRLEIVETGRRRRFSRAMKVRIVEESLSGDRQVSSTARRHGIANSLLFRWRREYREGRLTAAEAPLSFVSAVVVADAPAERSGDAGAGRMEIVVSGGRRVIVGADVEAAALARVLAVLEGR